MAALDFPVSPTDGQVFNAPNGVTYVWSSAYTAWQAQPMSAGFVGDVSAWATNAGSSTSLVTILFNTILSGNAGGWYNPANGRYTPPKGRYRLQATLWAYSSAGLSQFNVGIRKNGVYVTASIPLQTAPAANQYGSVTYHCIVDANGTDWFDVQQSGTAAASGSQALFDAFPISFNAAVGQAGTNAFNVRATAGDTINGPAAVNVFRSLAAPVEDYDPDGVWDLANGRFTAPNAGRYTFTCFGYAIQNPFAQMGLCIQHQNAAGAQIRAYSSIAGTDPNTYGANREVSADIQMAAGERVVFLWVAASGALSTSPSGTIGGVTAQLVYAYGHRIN
jgi:hypothetical protein